MRELSPQELSQFSEVFEQKKNFIFDWVWPYVFFVIVCFLSLSYSLFTGRKDFLLDATKESKQFFWVQEYSWLDICTQGRLEIHPCVLQDIGPLGPLPCSRSTSSTDHTKQGTGYRWPCAILGWLVLHWRSTSFGSETFFCRFARQLFRFT